ncbi:hypothetical protein [Bradyrhizobium cenepequi]|uniref:hypothetical protein n=1 Tax=Bradyrhizobium cenepequi TaxID=2821403 RepID=UPI001CE27F9E|nr:hypothetical protein [Bradyrhizobium cenepequi]MCA6107725.1 hypothetical protein [Bradyrhizobium cenepequi]
MDNLTINANISIDPSTPFCARTYYAGLRALNVNPCIRQKSDGGFAEFSAVGHEVGDVSKLARWAMTADPDWSIRKAYAFSVWDNRPASECQLVPLGA